MAEVQELRSSWTFLTQHARVLLLIARDADVRLRDVAAACGVTERAVQAIVTDLESAGYVTRTRHGRRNHYQVVRGTHFRHPAEESHEIAGLLGLFADSARLPGSPESPDTARE
ncbi:MarR family transcriptional regulator [Kitasatospora sp. NBC_00085]